ncbi:MAG: hypothetical protein EOO73_09490 [Myxococcales bacterium]|nr:MAG: hypothetical protein EOO73_09490 [Myxococcales bacterium]
MKPPRWLASAALVTLGFGAARALRAEPPPSASSAPQASTPRAQPSERLRRRMERLLEGPGLHPSALSSSLPAPSASAAWLPELSRRWSEVAANRQARREKSRAALMRELGGRLQDPRVRAELALHSQRVAELGRLEFLANNARAGEQRDKLLRRIEKLRAHEAARHGRSLAKLEAAAERPSPAPAVSGGARP